VTVTESCETCKFFSKQGVYSNEGDCHRYPPVVIATTNGIVQRHPNASIYNWCGEYVKKEEKA